MTDQEAKEEMHRIEKHSDRFNASMTLAVLALLIVLVVLPSMARANHDTIPVLAGKMPFMNLECLFDEKGQLVNEGGTPKSCTAFGEPGNEKEFWVAVLEPSIQLYVQVWRVPFGDAPNELVWKMAKRPTPKNGQNI